MINLAGNENADHFVRLELEEAGVPIIKTVLKKHKPEVPATFLGVLQFGNITIAFSRAWYYWMVHSTHRVPYGVAKKLNDIAGSDIRVEGFAGGTDVHRKGCDNYHVDSQVGLNYLVKILKNTFGEPTKITVSVEYLAEKHLINSAIYGS